MSLQNRIVNFKGGKIEVKWNKADESPVELMVYQDIGDDPWSGMEGFTPQSFLDATKDIPKTRALDIRINSAGGAVWDGLGIKTMIDEWPGKKTASIDGMAASVASWMAMGVDEIRAPRHAQMFIHDAWGMCMGNAEDMRSQAADLDKTSQQIAGIYAKKTGKTVDECRTLMKANSLFTAEEANAIGLIDKLTDDKPVQNFTELQLKNMRSHMVALNSIKSPAQKQGDNTTKNMNRKDKIALLNRWGLSVSKNATDAFLDMQLNMIRTSLPKNDAKFKNGKSGDHAADCDCQDCSMKNAPEPSAEPPGEDSEGGAKKAKETELWKAATDNEQNSLKKQLNTLLLAQRKNALQTSFDKLVSDGKIGAADIADWMPEALNATEDAAGVNPIIAKLNKIKPSLPGIDPLNIEVGESDSIEDLDKNVNNLLKAQAHMTAHARGPENLTERMEIANNSKTISRLINRLKKFKGGSNILSTQSKLPELDGVLVDAFNRQASAPRNANVITAGLQRQVILSEVMRAFRRQFATLEIFSHNFGNIPLEGTDIVQVPYYPLDTVASTEFTYANGYVINPNTQTLSKNILVGGAGLGAATGGSGRKYKGLQFTAYQVRRQPWLDIQKLSIMAGEQLAIDVRADILGTWINAANFGNAIWTGGSGGFNTAVVSNVLFQAAITNFWPKNGRNIVLNPAYFTNLASDPALYPYLYSGSTDILNDGVIENKYGFEKIFYDAEWPVVTNNVQGGSGAVVAGTDPYSAGFLAWPSALLVATAPIMPPPGVLKKLVAYEQITDDQTGLAFTYQFWGNESANVDNEIIECSYGSGLGELKALLRLTSQGN